MRRGKRWRRDIRWEQFLFILLWLLTLLFSLSSAAEITVEQRRSLSIASALPPAANILLFLLSPGFASFLFTFLFYSSRDIQNSLKTKITLFLAILWNELSFAFQRYLEKKSAPLLSDRSSWNADQIEFFQLRSIQTYHRWKKLQFRLKFAFPSIWTGDTKNYFNSKLDLHFDELMILS